MHPFLIKNPPKLKQKETHIHFSRKITVVKGFLKIKSELDLQYISIPFRRDALITVQ